MPKMKFEDLTPRPMPSSVEAEQHVWVNVEPIGPPNIDAWLALVEQHRQSVLIRVGILPDSTLDIAEDRVRDA